MKSRCRLFFGVLLPLGCVTTAVSATAQISFIGEFSDTRYTSDHAYGYSVQLWREDGKLFGLLSDATGLSGDTPVGVLDDVHLNPADGALSFTAKLSIQSVYLGSGKSTPTRDFFVFSGKLEKEKTLVGTLTHVDRLQEEHKPTVEQVRLVKAGTRDPFEVATYAEWKESADRVLKFRGPKW